MFFVLVWIEWIVLTLCAHDIDLYLNSIMFFYTLLISGRDAIYYE